MKFILPLLTLVLTSCITESNTPQPRLVAAYKVPSEFTAYPDRDTIFFGGYGSGMAYCKRDSVFYLLTDRGPNVDGLTPESKNFPIPDYSPTVGKFKIIDGQMTLIEKLALRNIDNTPLLGLPNQEGDGVTGEVAYDFDGYIIRSNAMGIDSEGIALMDDGSFWVSDEYAPFIIHFDASGRALKILSPSNGLPAHFAKRRANRGMEGLTVSSDQTKLYGIMQSPLYYPDKTTKNTSVVNRILELDILTGRTREFAYVLDNASLVCSEILFVDENTMYVIERDGEFNTPDKKAVKLIYSININQATDISDLVVEKMTAPELSRAGIIAVEKTLLVDVIDVVKDYPHDKLEGIALLSDKRLALVNDDDFGVNQGEGVSYVAKLNPQGELDRVVVYVVELP